MRPIDNTLAYLMSDTGRTRLIAAIIDSDRDRLWVREAARQAHLGMAGLYNELRTLEALGLIRKYHAGGAAFLVVDTGHALYAPLVALLEASAAMDAEIASLGRSWPRAHVDRGRWPGPHDVVPPVQLTSAFGASTSASASS